MTMTSLHQQIAEAEGYTYDPVGNEFGGYGLPDLRVCFFSVESFAFRLIEKYKLDIDSFPNYYIAYKGRIEAEDKDLTTAVFKAVLALVENKDD